MNVVAVIQARTGSTRLPGKVMYPLDGKPALEHVVTRTAHADNVDDVVVATSTESPDDVIAEYVPRFGADVIRDSESNVLRRFEQTVEEYAPDIVLRITGDSPLISPQFIDVGIEYIQTNEVDYVSAGLDWTFPRGITCEVFTAQSFKRVSKLSSKPRHQEHVTLYYHENPSEFDRYNIESSELFEEEFLQNRTDLRLTLDEPADYQLLETVYQEIEYSNVLNFRDVVIYIDNNNLSEINKEVQQKKPN